MSAVLDPPLAITAVGAVSAVGANALQTCTSIRAGIARLADHPFFESIAADPEWQPAEPLTAASYRDIDPLLDGTERLLELAIPPLVETGRQARLRRADLEDSALLVALPAPDDAVGSWNLEGLVAELCRRTGLDGFAASKQNRAGHTGVFELVREAAGLFESGQCRRAFVVAVDSFLSADRLELWDRAWRLRSARNADGFVPGEAACTLLIEPVEEARRRSARVLATVEAVSLGREPNPFASDRSSTGTGLCQVLDAVIPAEESAFWVCCDLNGESYRSFEWGVSCVRLHGKLSGLGRLDHPADSIGDVGAATGGILLAYAAHLLDLPAPPAPRAVLYTSADDGQRAALGVATAQRDRKE